MSKPWIWCVVAATALGPVGASSATSWAGLWPATPPTVASFAAAPLVGPAAIGVDAASHQFHVIAAAATAPTAPRNVSAAPAPSAPSAADLPVSDAFLRRRGAAPSFEPRVVTRPATLAVVRQAAPEALALAASRATDAFDDPEATSHVAAAIRARLETAAPAVAQFYAARAGAPIWVGEAARAGVSDPLSGPGGRALASALEQSREHGLAPQRYADLARPQGVDPVAVARRAAMVAASYAPPMRRRGVDPERFAEAELAATTAYLAYARDVSAGAIAPRAVARTIDRDRPMRDDAELLRVVADATDAPGEAKDRAGRLAAALASLAPQTDDYRALQTALRRFRDLDLAETAPVAAGKTLRPGRKGPRVAALRARLAALSGPLGFAPPAATDAPERYDETLKAAVTAFQARSGLSVDGVAGPNTLAAVNRTADDRAAQIAANLERARWMNKPLGHRRVVVNIPDFHAELIDGATRELRTRVVVGKPGRQETPEFSDEISYLVVNPSWNVPRSIATREMLPGLQENPDYLAERNMRLLDGRGREVDPWSVDWEAVGARNFSYRVQQRPGPNNALGDVKFIFPNAHAVYLHDTPARSLFNRRVRAFSHGCVRVADPTALAEVLLAPQNDDPAARYRRLRRTGREAYEELDAPVPVHIVYRTVWVEPDGGLQLRGDIYGRDDRLIEALSTLGAAGDLGV